MISILTHKTPDNLKHMTIARLQIKQTHHQCVILPILSPLMASAFFFFQISEYYLCISWPKINELYNGLLS